MKTLVIGVSIIINLLLILVLHEMGSVQTNQETTSQTYTIQLINSGKKEIYATSSNPNDNLYLDHTYYNTSYKEGNKVEVTYNLDGDIVEVEAK